MKQRILFLTLALVLVLVALFAPKFYEQDNSAPYVVASNFALYDALKAVAPKELDVVMLMPLGQDMHTFNPTPKDLKTLKNAKLFVYSSHELPQMLRSYVLQHKENAYSIDEVVVWRSIDKEHTHHEGHEHDHDEDVDIHYWLDVHNQKNIAKNLASKLTSMYPEDKKVIHTRLKAYLTQLDVLDVDIKQAFKACKHDTIVLTHDAFGYFSARYGFKTHAVQGLSADTQPNPKVLKAILVLVDKKNLDTVFFESFVPKTVASAISNQTGANIQKLHTLANISPKEFAQGVTYDTLMRYNMNKIAKARQCR